MQSLMILNVIPVNNVAVATLIFLSIVLLLTLVLLLAKHYLVNSGEVAISINDGAKLLHAPGRQVPPRHSRRERRPSVVGMRRQGKLRTMRGPGTVGRRRDTAHRSCPFFRKEVADHWRLGCQVKVKTTLTSRWRNRRLMSRNGNAR